MDFSGLRITWLGHATFRIETPASKTILIDPWIMGNPACPEQEKNVGSIDLMLATHGHFDHIGDAVEIAQKRNPTVVGIFELCHWLERKGVRHTSPMNKGGTQKIGDIKITMTHAVHSCGILDGDQIIYGGEACGYVLEFDNGFRLYHAGDTAVFSDMRIIHALYQPDLVMLPIGGHFTMSPREAAYAVQLLRPRAVIPMHFGTFPLLSGMPGEFRRMVDALGGVEVLEMSPGQTLGTEYPVATRRAS
ncbi:MAG: metal-dependent hydrolase [Terriglobales bacterium]|jgi:L-ascorbate metabolism protein UlaG (beta-lactamase superfamily)